VQGYVSEPGEEWVKAHSTTPPRNKLARPDHHKGKEEGRELASIRQRQCGVSDDRGVDGRKNDFSWC